MNNLLVKIYGKNFQRLLFVTMAIIIFVGMFILNKHTTLLVDDYYYAFNRVNGERIFDLYGIFQSEYNHYFHWGGRVIVHSVVQFFMMYDKTVFNIFNAAAYLLMVLTIYIHAVGKLKCYPFLLVIINLSLFLWMPAFGQTFLWLTGACNYLWGPLFVFLFLLPYRFQLDRESPIFKSKIWYPLLFTGGIIAGWTNENLGVTLVCIIGVCIYFYKKNYNRIYSWCIWGWMGSLFGAVLLISAPGNFARLSTMDSEINIVGNFITITRLFFKDSFLLIPITAIILMLMFLSHKIKNKQIFYLYAFGMIISMYSMMGSPYFADRAKLGTLSFCIIIAARLYAYLDMSLKIKQAVFVCTISLLCITSSQFNTAKKDIMLYETRTQQNLDIVKAAKESNILDVTIYANKPETKYCAAYGLEDISKDYSYWTSKGFARYYGLKTVRAVNKQ